MRRMENDMYNHVIEQYNRTERIPSNERIRSSPDQTKAAGWDVDVDVWIVDISPCPHAIGWCVHCFHRFDVVTIAARCLNVRCDRMCDQVIVYILMVVSHVFVDIQSHVFVVLIVDPFDFE